jgi:hypothetical protein
MTYVHQLFIFSLIFSFVLPPRVAIGDDQIAAEMADCLNYPNKEWDSNRNMCVTTVESKETRDEVRACAELEGEAQKACHDRIAQEKTGVTPGGEGKDSLMMISLLASGASGIMLASSSKAFGGGGNTCTSLYIMGATSLGGLAAEFIFKRSAKKALEELRERYEKEASIEDAYTAQKRAFEYLKEEQLAISELAKKRFHSYMVVAAGFSAAAVYAIMEATGTMGMARCGGSEEDTADADADADADLEAPIDETAQAPTDTGTPPANPEPGVAAETGPAAAVEDPALAQADADALVGGATSMALGSPVGIAVVSGIAAATTGYLGFKAKEQSDQSKSQAERIQTVIDGFNHDFSQLCPGGREDLTKPECYCYLGDGSQNQSRSNSATCQELWAERTKNFAVGAGRYDGAIGATARQGCFTTSRQFDPDCRCRDMKNAAGQNACMKVGVPSNAVSGNVGQAMSLPNLMSDLNKMVNGEFESGNLNSADLQNRQAAASRVRKKVFDDFNKMPDQRQKFPSDNDLLAAVLKNNAPRISKRVNNDPLANISDTRPAIQGLDQIAKDMGIVADQVTQATGTTAAKRGARGRANPKGKKKDDYFYDFSAQSGGTRGEILDGFMEQNYNYGGNDIVNNEDLSLWEVISYRYVNSGLRRLFGDELDEAEVSDTP